MIGWSCGERLADEGVGKSEAVTGSVFVAADGGAGTSGRAPDERLRLI